MGVVGILFLEEFWGSLLVYFRDNLEFLFEKPLVFSFSKTLRKKFGILGVLFLGESWRSLMFNFWKNLKESWGFMMFYFWKNFQGPCQTQIILGAIGILFLEDFERILAGWCLIFLRF